MAIEISSPSAAGRSWARSRVETGLVWLLGHAAVLWPFVVFGVVLAASWTSLHHITIRDFRTALGSVSPFWLVFASVATVVNIVVMGFYDVIAFGHTRSRSAERWRFGAVAFAWSNFLTLGPLAGPAIRFWLYRSSVDAPSELHSGVVAVTTAFMSGLSGWALAVWLSPALHLTLAAEAALAFALTFTMVFLVRAIAGRAGAPGAWSFKPLALLALVTVGWLDWLLAASAFGACIRSTGAVLPVTDVARAFFLGQAVGLASLVPGGFGSSDAFWIAHVGIAQSSAAAALMVYRIIYYVAPWAIASLLLLAWATERNPRRVEIARRIVAGLVGGGGVLIMLSSASPALHARLVLVQRFIALPLVEAGQLTAALAGLVLLVLARGLARGYAAAFRGTLMLLALAGLASILKGFDWEEALVLGSIAVVASSQAALFDRPSRGSWVERPDLVLLFAALAAFVTFGALSYHISAHTLETWTRIGYRFQATRFLRTAGSMALAVLAATLYVVMRAPVGFKRLSEEEIDDSLQLHSRLGGRHTNPLMVATGDKAVFRDGDRGFCLYRIIGPYLVVFSDPVVGAAADRTAFLDALFAFAGELDRRPVFYQLSLEWIPPLHDRGYDFFKLGEQAEIPLDRVTVEGHAGKLYRQLLRRAERDGIRFAILTPEQIASRMPEFAAVSDDWLRTKQVAERQFSMGFFDDTYLRRFPCAIVEEARPDGRLLAFANLLEGPNRHELSVDLMRYRSDGPQVMDFLLAALFLEGKRQGYERFNLGMAPLASVGVQRGAHLHERLARLLFQRGQQWYNFQGLRQYKEKFHPEWVPRYMAYQTAWEWPMAIAYVSALIAGGWGSILVPVSRARAAREPYESPVPRLVEG
jgi:phosphatidylglycerol lysyltransferase